jgi:hypothetical protein
MKTLGTNKTLQLISKKIDLLKSTVLFENIINPGTLKSQFEIYNSDWTVKNGWLSGRNNIESAGMAILKQDFPGNILLEFECRTVLPSTHDINFMWNTEWSDQINSCGTGYIGSICGWWTGRVGIERSPDFKLRATTSGFRFKPGRSYKVQAGVIEGTCFIFVDGILLIELDDPDPIDNKRYNKIAFSVYKSWVQFKNIIIRQISWSPVEMYYKPEF